MSLQRPPDLQSPGGGDARGHVVRRPRPGADLGLARRARALRRDQRLVVGARFAARRGPVRRAAGCPGEARRHRSVRRRSAVRHGPIIFADITEDGRSRWGFLGSLGGAVLGGLTWVGVAGVTLHDGLVVSSAVLAAVRLLSVAAVAYARFPTRALGLLGAVILAVVLIDWIYLLLLLPRLAELPTYPWFGTSQASIRAIRPAVLPASAPGWPFALLDGRRR